MKFILGSFFLSLQALLNSSNKMNIHVPVFTDEVIYATKATEFSCVKNRSLHFAIKKMLCHPFIP